MTKGMLYRHGVWLQPKRNFLLASTILVGAALAVPILWMYGDDRIGFWLFTIAPAVLGGFVWGLIMWPIVGWITGRADTRLRQIAAKPERESTDSYRSKASRRAYTAARLDGALFSLPYSSRSGMPVLNP